jgi:hypothetical protein
MAKLVLLSLILGTMIIPQRLAKIESRAKGYGKLRIWMAVTCIVYIQLLLYVYPRVEGK